MAAEDPVSLQIDQKVFRSWTTFELKWALDSYATVEFSSPFEPTSRDFRDAFRPFTYKTVYCYTGNEKLFLGRMVGVHPRAAPDKKEVSVTAYALPAVLNDCSAPASALPLEFRKLTLEQIASALVGPFGIRTDFREIDQVQFDKVALEADRKIHDFLVELAQQRNLVITSAPEGHLLCWRSVAPGNPVARLSGTASPVLSVAASFEPQEYYSEITGHGPASRKKKGGSHTEPNPWLTDVVRPHSFKLDNIEKGDVPTATKAKIARMFANAASFTVELATWRDPQGHLWQPNTTVKLLAPDAMIYRETEFIIREITLRQDAQSSTATLELVLPGVFTGKVPAELPWMES